MRVTQILVLGLIGAAPAAAFAGELSATSRGTVAISISVPPHIMVTSTSMRNGNPRSSKDGFCVATNGIRSFRLMAVDSPGSSRQTISNRMLRQLGQISCGGSGEEFEIVTDEPAGEEQVPDAAQPLTVLVVPD